MQELIGGQLLRRRQVFQALAGGLATAMGAPRFGWAGEISAAKLAGVHRVGVISALGDQALISKFARFFDSKITHLPIADWKLDELAIETASAALADRFEIVPVSYDKTTFVHRTGGFLGVGESPSVGSLVRALPKSNIDAYLVIQSHPLEISPSHWIEGLGAARDPGAAPPYVYAEYWVTLARAVTGQYIAVHWSDLRDPRGSNSIFAGVDMVAVPEDPSAWADTADQMTDAQKRTLRKYLQALVVVSLRNTLQKMGLANL